jgi:hypothetical protein
MAEGLHKRRAKRSRIPAALPRRKALLHRTSRYGLAGRL